MNLHLTALVLAVLPWAAGTALCQIPVRCDAPYFEDFEAGPGGWATAGGLWVLATPAQSHVNGAFSGASAWVTDPIGDYPAGADESVVSPAFDFSGLAEDPELRLRINHSVEFFFDGVRLEMDLGAGFFQVGTIGPAWYDSVLSASGIGGEGFTGGSGAWVLATQTLAGAAGHSRAVLRMRFGSDDTVSGEGVAFDDVSIIGGLPACAAGNVSVGTGGGGPYDVLLVNGGPGDCARVAAVGSDPFTIELIRSPEMAFETFFSLWGMVGVPTSADEVDLPLGIGTMCFLPCFVQPSNPSLFLLTDNFGIDTGCNELVSSGGTPFLLNVPGTVVPLKLTLQALVFEAGAPVNVAVSNMIVIDTAP